MDVNETYCANCGEFFPASPRHKDQEFCLKPECRKAKKARWQRQKMKNDPDYRSSQRLSHKKWAASKPDFWKDYRAKNSEKTERNRLLQKVRNAKRRSDKEKTQKETSPVPANVDVSEAITFKPCAQYWLVPLSSKAAPVKVNIVLHSST